MAAVAKIYLNSNWIAEKRARKLNVSRDVKIHKMEAANKLEDFV